jgi:hypothetical protein
LPLAAYLLIKGQLLIGTEPVGAGRVAFLFEDTSERVRLGAQFHSQHSQVDPLQYLNAIKALKAMANEMNSNNMRGTTDDKSIRTHNSAS